MPRLQLVPDVNLILRKGNKVLLGLRMNTSHYNNQYCLPAGHLEENESAASALIRETFEETGISIKPKDLDLVHVMHRHKGNENQRMSLFFCCTHWQGLIENKEADKCGGWEWFDVKTLPESTAQHVKRAIDCFNNNIIYSEDGWR